MLVSREVAPTLEGFPTLLTVVLSVLLVLVCVFVDPGFRRTGGGKRSDRNPERKLIITVFGDVSISFCSESFNNTELGSIYFISKQMYKQYELSY